ncbi:HAD family hydrolase [Candidatus Woesearchaeota archaeon]|nr:HAD family hydrolase [Candidatus Woesearchaeota archaeon]
MLIIFDLDDTLIDTFGCSQPVKFRLALKKMIQAGLKVTSFDAAFQQLMEINKTTTNGKETLRRFLNPCHSSENIYALGVNTYYGGKQFNFPVHALEGALDLLTYLRDQHHDLVLITSGVKEEQYGKMKKAKIDPSVFRKIILTGDYNKKKEYLIIQKDLAYPPHEIIVCGDKFKTDLLPAKELGMKTVHVLWGRGKVDFPSPGEVDYSITKLRELKKIIADYDLKTNRSCDSSRRRRQTPPPFN